MENDNSENLNNESSFIEKVIQSATFEIIAELGSVNMSLNDILQISENDSVLMYCDLRKVKMKINNVMFAYGEIIELNGQHGIKITKLLDSDG